LLQVIGVVGTTVVDKSAKILSPSLSPHAPAILAFARSSFVRTPTGAADRPVRAQIQPIDKNLAFTNAQTVQQILDKDLAARHGCSFARPFGALALIPLRIGIYGVLPIPAQRTK